MLVHAAGFSARNVQYGTFAIALAAQDESALLRISERLSDIGIEHVPYRDPDHGNQLMSLGIYPVKDRRVVRRVLSNLPLVGKNGAAG